MQNIFFNDWDSLLRILIVTLVAYPSIIILLRNNKINYCINCAAYTAVDKAESEQDDAFKVNELGVTNLSKVSADNGAILIHISTDFVFDGKKSYPYVESDKTNTQGVYGLS